MAIFRSLRALSRNPNAKKTLSSSLFGSSSPIYCHNHHLSRSTRFLSPLSKWMTTPFHGPLFLSSPPWKLSQSATPFLFQSDVLFLPKALNLLNNTPSLAFNLGFESASYAQPNVVLVNGTEEKELSGRDGFVESFANLPNLISMSRLLSGPLLGWMIVQEMYLPAFVGLAVSGATDWLDGYVARKMGINSVVGSYLDPLADKVLIGCVALAMVDKGLLHSGLVGLIVMRDVALVGGATYNRARSLDWNWKSWSDFFNLDGICTQKVEPLLISKVNTLFQLVLVTAALLQPEFGTQDTVPYITYLSWLVASTTVASTVAYGAQHLRSGSKLMKKY